MFFYTDTADAPWTIVKSDDKKRARLNCMQHFLSSLDYPDKDQHVIHGPDPLIVGPSSQVFEKDSTSGAKRIVVVSEDVAAIIAPGPRRLPRDGQP